MGLMKLNSCEGHYLRGLMMREFENAGMDAQAELMPDCDFMFYEQGGFDEHEDIDENSVQQVDDDNYLKNQDNSEGNQEIQDNVMEGHDSDS